MRKRNIEKHIFFDKSETQTLQRKAKAVGMTEAALIRSLVSGYEPKALPDDSFHDFMRQIAALGNSMNQIARKANALGILDAPYYKQQAELVAKFELDVYERFMLPDKKS